MKDTNSENSQEELGKKCGKCGNITKTLIYDKPEIQGEYQLCEKCEHICLASKPETSQEKECKYPERNGAHEIPKSCKCSNLNKGLNCKKWHHLCINILTNKSPQQPESEGVEDWEKEFDKFMVNEYSKWKIGRVECKNFIRSLLEAQAKQIREEERERAAGIVNDSLNLVRLPWGKMEPTDFSPRACFWVNTSRSETQTKILNPTKNDPK